MEIAKVLLECGVDANSEAGGALIWAIMCHHLSMVDLLLSHGANPSLSRDEAFRCASGQGDVAIMARIIAHQPYFPNSPQEAYHLAVAQGHLDMVQYLALQQFKPPLNLKSGNKIARQQGHTLVLDWLKGMDRSQEERRVLAEEASLQPKTIRNKNL